MGARPGLQRPACYKWAPVRKSLVINEGPSEDCYKWSAVFKCNGTQRNGIVFKCNGTQRNGIVCKCNGTQRTEKIRLLWTLALILTCNDGRKGLVVINGTLIRSQRTTKVNDVQRHGNDEQQNGQRTMLFGRRMYAWELQADDDASRSNSSNACGRFRSVKGAHDGAGRLVGQPVRQWLPVGGATTELHCNTFGGRARRPSVTSQPWLSSSHGVAVDEW